MHPIDLFWRLVRYLHDRGLGKLAAWIANIAGGGRQFSVDADGDWVNRQAEAIFFSPYVFTLHAAQIDSATRDYWFHGYAPKPDDIVFDVGAGIGEECALLAKTGAQVYAIEAQPDIYRCLCKAVAANGWTAIKPLNLALGAEDGETSIAMACNHIGNSVLDDVPEGMMKAERVRVPMRSLDSLCSELGIAEIDYLKMNIEGAEKLAIQGMSKVPVRHLVISCHDFIGASGFMTKSAVSAFMGESGHRITTRPDASIPAVRDYLYGELT